MVMRSPAAVACRKQPSLCVLAWLVCAGGLCAIVMPGRRGYGLTMPLAVTM